MALSFEVTTHVLPGGAGALLGFCDLLIDGKLQLTGFKVFKSKKDDSLFIGAPSQPSKKLDENGKTVYFETVRFIDAKEKEDDYRTPFQDEVYKEMLDAFKAAMAAGAKTPTTGGGTRGKTPVSGISSGPPRAPKVSALWADV